MPDAAPVLVRNIPAPVLIGLADLGLTQEQIADMVGVSQTLVSCWYRGKRGIDPAYIILMTGMLAVAIDAVDAEQSAQELPTVARRTLELRNNVAKQWLALQVEMNKQFLAEAQDHALAMEERLSERNRSRLTPVVATTQKHETRTPKLAGQGAGFADRNTP